MQILFFPLLILMPFVQDNIFMIGDHRKYFRHQGPGRASTTGIRNILIIYICRFENKAIGGMDANSTNDASWSHQVKC